MIKVDRNHPTELNTLVTTDGDDKEEPVASENTDDGNKRVAQADVLPTFNSKSSDPKNSCTAISSSVQIAPDPKTVKQLQDALEVEQAKVQQLQHQLATVDRDRDAPAQHQYKAPRRRSKLVRRAERSFDVLVGGALVFVIAVVLIIALIFSFGGFSNVPTTSEF